MKFILMWILYSVLSFIFFFTGMLIGGWDFHPNFGIDYGMLYFSSTAIGLVIEFLTR